MNMQDILVKTCYLMVLYMRYTRTHLVNERACSRLYFTFLSSYFYGDADTQVVSEVSDR